jgi:small subunit ribosomal protein S4
MSGLHEPVGKVSRRLGVGITAKGSKILDKRPYKPGQHGNNGGRPAKISDYGQQLLEKQKIRLFYGLRESQFKGIFETAVRMSGPTGENLMSLLERRLDNVIFRQGLAVTRRQARQLVNHGHFEVNGVPTNIPSFRVRPGDVIKVREGSKTSAYFKDLFASDALRHRHAPEWFEQTSADRTSWKIARFPNRDEAELVRRGGTKTGRGETRGKDHYKV